MMRFIRYLFLSLVCSFSLCAKADTNVNYSAQLANIYSVLNTIAQDQVVIQDYCLIIGEMVDTMQSAIQGGKLPDSVYWTNLGNAIIRIRDTINDIFSNTSSIESFASYIPDIFNKTESINSYLYNDLGIYLSAMQDSLASLDTFGDSLQDMIDAVNNCASIAAEISINQADLNQEQTQLDILDALEDIKGRITVFPEEDIHTLVGITQNIYNTLALMYAFMNKWDSMFDNWSTDYFSQFGAHMGSTMLSYFKLNDAPDFPNGYRTTPVNVETTGSDFVTSLHSMLEAHLNVLVDINNAVLFIAKALSTNGQAQVENDFENQKDEVAASLGRDYQQLREYTYRGITYNLRDTKLYDVSTFISSFESSQYDAVKVHTVGIEGFEVFGNLPTYFEFKYDLTPIATYLELVRNVFTVFWVLFFASFWIFLVSIFYRFYHFLYRLLCMVPGQSAPPPGPGLPVPSGGAVMA